MVFGHKNIEKAAAITIKRTYADKAIKDAINMAWAAGLEGDDIEACILALIAEQDDEAEEEVAWTKTIPTGYELSGSGHICHSASGSRATNEELEAARKRDQARVPKPGDKATYYGPHAAEVAVEAATATDMPTSLDENRDGSVTITYLDRDGWPTVYYDTPPEEEAPVPTKENICTALTHGALVGAATAANRAAISVAIDAAGDNVPAVLQTPSGRKAIEVAMPAILLYVADSFPDVLPLEDKARAGAVLALEGASADGVKDVFAEIFPFLKAYAAALAAE